MSNPPFKPQDNVDVTLVVACVHTGGNTAGGEYFFSYTPDFIMVEKQDTTITVSVDDQTNMGLEVISVFACDPHEQFVRIDINIDPVDPQKQQVVVWDINTVKELVPFTIVLRDKNGKTISCDPQTGNGGTIGDPGI